PLDDALDCYLLTVCRGRETAGRAQQLANRFLALELVDRRRIHAAGDGCERSDGPDVNDVARLELHVLRLVAAQQQIVEIEVDDDAVAPLDLYAAHRP